LSFEPPLLLLTVHEVSQKISLKEGFEFARSPIRVTLPGRLARNCEFEYLLITKPVARYSKFPVSPALSVPYIESFYDILFNAGGARLLLPLLQNVPSCCASVLKSILLLIPEDQILDAKFVRNLSCLIHQIAPCQWSQQSLSALVDIACAIPDAQLHALYITLVILDFAFWKEAPPDLHQQIFVRHLSQIFDACPQMFVSSVPLRGLLARFYGCTTILERSPQIMRSVVDLLMKYSDSSIRDGDGLIIFATAFQTAHADFGKSMIRLLYNYLSREKSPLGPFFRQYGLCGPFFEVLQCGNDKLGFWLLQCLFSLFKTLPNDQEREFLANLMGSFSLVLNEQSPLLLSPAYDFLFDRTQLPDQKNPGTGAIRYPELVPLFAWLCERVTRANALKYVTMLFHEFEKPGAGRIFARLLEWRFWVLYLGLTYRTFDDFMGILVAFARYDPDHLDALSYFRFLLQVCVVYDCP
jgi:hypothetical protein